MRTHPFRTPLVALALLTFLTLAAAPRRAHAQDRPPPRSGARGPVELVCLESLDVGELSSVVRTIVEPEAEIVSDRPTNCFVIVGARDLAPLRATLTALEARATERRRARPRTAR